MPYVLNSEALTPGRDIEIDGFSYSYETLLNMAEDDRSGLGVTWAEPDPIIPSVEDLTAAVDAERDRRIDGGFTFMGLLFQSRPSDRENVMGAAQLAMAAIGQGAQPGDLRWADPNGDFEWILADNSKVTLDAYEAVALFQTGVAYKKAITFHARDLKDAILSAEDPASIDIEAGWPE